MLPCPPLPHLCSEVLKLATQHRGLCLQRSMLSAHTRQLAHALAQRVHVVLHRKVREHISALELAERALGASLGEHCSESDLILDPYACKTHSHPALRPCASPHPALFFHPNRPAQAQTNPYFHLTKNNIKICLP